MRAIIPILFAFLIISIPAKSNRIQQNLYNTNKIDSTFLDFFDQIMFDQDLQRARVLLPFNLDGKEIKHTKLWQHIPFYSQQEYMPMMTADTITDFDKHINMQSVKIHIVDFSKNTAQSYGFEKISNLWYIRNTETIPFNSLPDLAFINFLTKFSNDSAFQVNSIVFPLHAQELDDEYEIVEKTIKLEKWKFYKFTKEINQLMLLSNIDTNNKYRNIYLRGVHNGIWIKYVFEKINNSWMLIKIFDHST